MRQHLIFAHQNYPAQFGPIIQFLLKNYDVDITFISEYVTKPVFKGVKHCFFKPARTGHEQTPYFFSRFFEQECASMHGVYDAFRQANITDPDVMVGHTAFGTLGLFHVAFPEIPKIGFFELFYDPFENISDKRPEYPTRHENKLRIPLRNATQLLELEYCSKGYSPTPFQRSTYPEAYQWKLETLFDGIDVNLYQPGEISSTSELKRTWPANTKIVTYVSRGLEAMRGFDIFMEVAHRVSQKRSDVHFVIAGNPKTHYGSELMNIHEKTFKEHVLKRHPYDLNRYHFLDWVSEPALVDLFRISDCHFYWTVPFTLSWSSFQALSTGVLMMGSNTAPVRDLLVDGVNGLMVEPRDLDAMVELMLETLDHPEKFKHMREIARADMVEKYSFEVCLPKLAEYYMTSKMPYTATKNKEIRGQKLTV